MPSQVIPPLVEPPAALLPHLLENNGTSAQRRLGSGPLAHFHGAVERLVPSYSFGVRQRLWAHFKEEPAIRLRQARSPPDRSVISPCDRPHLPLISS